MPMIANGALIASTLRTENEDEIEPMMNEGPPLDDEHLRSSSKRRNCRLDWPLPLKKYLRIAMIVSVSIALLAHLHNSNRGGSSTTASEPPILTLNSTAAEPIIQDTSCSCFNFTATKECCLRKVLRAHKFGHDLSSKLYGKFKKKHSRAFVIGNMGPEQISPVDYRHVTFLRNIYISLVSGYLYHRSGRECWLKWKGNQEKKPEKRWDWQQYVVHSRLGQDVPEGDKSICQYLADNSEEIGMRVYIDVAFGWWYKGVRPYIETVDDTKVMFVCMEDYSNPEKQKVIFYETMEWLYPGRKGRDFQYKQANGAGNHASSHDPDVRQRLLDLIHKLDDEVFDHIISEHDALIPCGKDGV
jgi:hypothetical protein